jgi:hypothetical protein
MLLTMPPSPLEYQRAAAIASFLRASAALRGHTISAITRFLDPGVLASFGLPEVRIAS